MFSLPRILTKNTVNVNNVGFILIYKSLNFWLYCKENANYFFIIYLFFKSDFFLINLNIQN